MVVKNVQVVLYASLWEHRGREIESGQDGSFKKCLEGYENHDDDDEDDDGGAEIEAHEEEGDDEDGQQRDAQRLERVGPHRQVLGSIL
jgi:hypothetical protein